METYSGLSEILLHALDDESLRQSLQTDFDSAVRTMKLEEKLSAEELTKLRMVFKEGVPSAEEAGPEPPACPYRGYQ
jgi:hypothetical protein